MVDAVDRLVKMIVVGVRSQRQTLSVIVDVTKAFDCVDQGTLLHNVKDKKECHITSLNLILVIGNNM